MSNIGTSKSCTKCGAEKTLSEFHKQTSTKDGFRNKCKVCILADDAEKYATSPDKYKARAAAYRSANVGKTMITKAAYYVAKYEKVNADVAKWQKANANQLRVHKQNRRARKRKVGGILSKGFVEKLFELQRGKCACCGLPLGKDFHRDHIMPLALGGENTDSNMQLLHQHCNNQKHAKHPIDFMQQRGFLL